jgi:predicted GTPase
MSLLPSPPFMRCDHCCRRQANVEAIVANAALYNPRAKVFVTNSIISLDDPSVVKGKSVLLVEDGPTLTHGEMPYGAGMHRQTGN